MPKVTGVTSGHVGMNKNRHKHKPEDRQGAVYKIKPFTHKIIWLQTSMGILHIQQSYCRTVRNQHIEQQFESSSIVRRLITQVNSGQFNLFLQLGLMTVLLLFLVSMTSAASTTLPSNARDCSYSVFHSCNYFSNPRSGSSSAMVGFSLLIY